MIAILATTLLNRIDFGGNELLKQFVDVVMITFTLVLLGEVVPKVYASHHNVKFAAFMAYPLVFLARVFYPISFVLTRTSSVIERRMLKHTHNVSLEDIKDAIEITSSEETSQEEKKILKGVINFGNIYVKQIMTGRLDVVAHDIDTPFDQLVKSINENRYSRVPIYNNSFDKITGILYIKDLIPYLNEPANFNWQNLVREPYFVPDTKKIDLLLQEFKLKKVHLAVVVDEYGGANGIVTMEDILEEIVGDINDEFDDEEVFYSRLDDENFVFDGKTSLTDVIRIMDLEDEVFEKVRGEAESIGGLMIEMAGKIPASGEKMQYENFRFTVELSDKRRVRRVKVSKLNETAPVHS
jgi:gliding motility-associated protein GldE